MTSPRTSQRNRHVCARTIVTLQQQDGGYALLWKHYDNNNLAATLYCCCCRCILHLQQYSRRLNLFFFPYLTSCYSSSSNYGKLVSVSYKSPPAQDRDSWRALGSKVINLQVSQNAGNFSSS